MATNTTRLGLIKPDFVDVVDISDLNTNADDIDAAVGAAVVTSSTRPSSPWLGQIIHETDTDKTLVWDGVAWVETGVTDLDDLGDVDITSAESGDTLVYDGADWVNAPLGNNAIANGDFKVWQRGTSFAAAGSVIYSADRWAFYRQDLSTGATVTRQSPSLAGFQYCARVQRNSGNSGTFNVNIAQTFETTNSLHFAGKTVTVSFYARSGANFSAAGSNLKIRLGTGTGTDESTNSYRAGAWAGFSQAFDVNRAITSTWQRYTVTASVSSSVTQLILIFGFVPVGTAGADDWFEITGVQLEVGPVATPFEFKSFGQELLECQRYYAKTFNYATAPVSSAGQAGSLFVNASGTTATGLAHILTWTYRVTMRAAPTITTFSPSAAGSGWFTSGGASVAAAVSNIGTNGAVIFNNATSSATVNAGIHATADAEL